MSHYFIKEAELFIWQPKGCATLKTLNQFVEKIERCESDYPSGFDRFIDFSGLESINLNFDDIHQIAQDRKRDMKSDRTIKIAIWAPTDVAFGIGRMYQTIIFSDKIIVNVCRTIEEASAWIQREVDLLANPDSSYSV